MHLVLQVIFVFWLTNAVENRKIAIMPLGSSIDEDFKPNEQRTELCRLPPYPKHGGYVVVGGTGAGPGDVLDRVSLVQYTTDREKRVFQVKRLTCSSGQWYQDLIEYESGALNFYTSWCPYFCSSFTSELWADCASPSSDENIKGLPQTGTNSAEKHSEPNDITAQKVCRLPPYPSHGSYIVQDSPDARPGDVFQNVSLIQYISDQSNTVVRIKHYKCSSGAWYQKVFREAGESLHFRSSWCPALCSRRFGKKVSDLSYSSSSQSRVQNKLFLRTTTASCALPPHPKFGNYTVVSEPDDVDDRLRLNYTCNAGYSLVGNRNVYCRKGVWSEELPECTKFCRLVRQPGVEYSCGETGAGAGVGPCVTLVQDGSKVTPRCSSPYYESRSPLKPMTCEDGEWKNIPNCKPVCGLRVQAKENVTDDARVKAPWQIGIYLKNVTPYRVICGGSIVARNLVISAAVCFSSESGIEPLVNFLVIAGKLHSRRYQSNDDKAQESDVKEIKISPWYTGPSTSNQHDIALVFVRTPFEYNEYIWPICLDFDENLDKKQLLEGRSGIVAGWRYSNGRVEDVLQVFELPNVDTQRCVSEALASNEIVEKQTHITGDKICAGYSDGEPICPIKNGAGYAIAEVDPLDSRKRCYYLRGVLSLYAKLVCHSSFYTLFTKVSAYENFIKDNSAGVVF